MQVQLNEAELEVAVTLYLTNQGMNLKNKDLTFSFEGECSMDIEPSTTDSPVTPKPKQTRKKAAPKPVEVVEEPKVVEEESIPVEDVVDALVEQVIPTAEEDELFPLPKATEAVVKNDNSIFG